MTTTPPASTTPNIRSFPLGPYQTNCYVVTVPEHDGCWVVDCGMEAEPLLAHIRASKVPVESIILTHAHVDHITDIDRLRALVGDSVPLLAHEAERGWCSDPNLNLSAALDTPVSVGEPTKWLSDGETLRLGPTEWTVVHLPGHSPGGIALVHTASARAITGDTLFAGSIGRIDLPGADPEAMALSLKLMLDTMPDSMRILPGHGPATTIGQERRSNPFLQQL